MSTALRRHFHYSQRDERGSALVIALVMVFVVGIIVASVLSYAGEGLTTNATVSKDGRSQYAAEGGIEAAIQNILNAPGSTNLGYTDGPSCNFVVPGSATSPEADVTCTAR